MADVVDSVTRSRMMSGIRAANTKPEVTVRRLLFANGYRFRLHRKDLAGTPDIVLPRFKLAIQVNGCFWHGHEGCHLFRVPKSRSDFWSAKIDQNVKRDAQAIDALAAQGWRTLVIWECALRGRTKLDPALLLSVIKKSIHGSVALQHIRGSN